MLDFAGKRWWYLTASLILFLIAAAALVLWGLKPGIEFTSGSSFTIEFTERTVSQGEVRTAMGDLGHPEARVQGAGTNKYLIRTGELENAPSLDSAEGPDIPGEINVIEDGLRSRFGALNRTNFSTVSETVSSEIARNATLAVIVASIAILIYISIVFRALPKAWLYGSAAIIAVLHDAFIILGLFAFLGEFHGTEVDTAFITAILTVIGFSVHDTIVVFDRIRENKGKAPDVTPNLINTSVTQTMSRTLLTGGATLVTLLIMYIWGGSGIHGFNYAMFIGTVTGTYSSFAIAAPLLVYFQGRKTKQEARRARTTATPPASASAAS